MVRRWIVGVVWIASACGPVVTPEDGETSGEDSTSSTSPTTTTSSGPSTTSGPSTDPSDPTTPTTMSTSGNPTEPSTDPTIDPESDSCGLFIGCHGDYGGDGGECDVWAQDCPRGEKCMPWANDGGAHWNSLRCSPVYDEAQIGDPCIVEGSYMSGIDNCEIGSMCLFVDPDTNEGECVANCLGSEAKQVCVDPQTTCVVGFDGTMINCLVPCNPVLQDCAAGGCYPTDDNFVCGPTFGDGFPAQTACVHDWDCAPGTVCISGDLVPTCSDEKCCAPICDLAAPETCGELVCLYWFEEGQAPPGLEQVGVCVEG